MDAFHTNVGRMFVFNADCKTGDPQCGVSYTAVGTRWTEFQITCGYHCGPTTFSFQNIQSGQVNDQPPSWRAGGTQIPDLNSSSLARRLCKPLRVPHGFPDPYAATTPGGIVFAGRFAVALDWYQSSSGLEDQRYVLERCGTHLHDVLLNSAPGGFPLAINSHAVVWPAPGLKDKTIHGVFLLRRQPFKITNLPAATPAGPTKAVQQVVLTPRRIYALDGGGRLYAAAAPLGTR